MGELKQTTIYLDDQININSSNFSINGNKQYIVYSSSRKIKIYFLEKNKTIEICTKACKSKIHQLTMNKIYENVFLALTIREIYLFEIVKLGDIYKYEERINIKTEDNFTFAKFSEYDANLLGTLSDDNLVRIWNIDSKFNILTIKYKNLYVMDLFFNQNKNFLMIQLGDDNDNYLVSIYDISYGTDTKKLLERNKAETIFEISESKFLKNLFVNKSYIEILDLEKEKDNILKKELNKENYNDIFFLKKTQLLILFYSKEIIIINIANFDIIFKEILTQCQLFTNYYINKENNNISFFNYFNNCSIISIKLNNIKIIDAPQKNQEVLFTKDSKIIFSKPNLNFDNSEIKEEEIKRKKYLEIEEIKKELCENYKLSLDIKKGNVITELKKYNPSDSVIDKYIFLLKLLIQDNTNKDLLKIYIQFLKENNETLKNIYNNYEDFESEYNNYKVVFSPEEVELYFEKEKISEKKEFLDLLEKINNLKEEEEKFTNLVNEFKSYDMGRFNQGIEYNNKELYWFRNKSLIIYALLEMDFSHFKLMKYCIKSILDKKLCENNIILNNYKIITLLVILIVDPLKKDYCDENLILIESLIQKRNEYISPDPTIILNTAYKYSLTDYKADYDIYSKTIELPNIQKFLKNVFHSNVFKEAFQILYPNYIKYPLETEEEADNYIKNHIKFVPFKSSESNAMTDKLTLESYIFLAPKKIEINDNIQAMQRLMIEKILFSSTIIKTNYHELNHNLYNMFYYHENGNIPLNTPRRGDQSENWGEGGIDLEIILFGKKINNISLKEALYILNEENYKKSIIKFKEDFQNLYSRNENIDDCKIKGVFSHYVVPDNILNVKKDLICIKFESESDYPFINALDYNDVLGRGVNIKNNIK